MYCSSRADQKIGMDTPSSENPMKKRSTRESRRTADRMPAGMPMTQDTAAAAAARISVLGKAVMISLVTLRLSLMEMPRSPCRAPRRKRR